MGTSNQRQSGAEIRKHIMSLGEYGMVLVGVLAGMVIDVAYLESISAGSSPMLFLMLLGVGASILPVAGAIGGRAVAATKDVHAAVGVAAGTLLGVATTVGIMEWWTVSSSSPLFLAQMTLAGAAFPAAFGVIGLLAHKHLVAGAAGQ